MDRRSFLQAAAASAAFTRDAAAAPLEWTVADMQNAMAQGSITSEALTTFYLRRIAATNLHGPALRAVIETNPDAMAMARQLDRERMTSGPRSPLHGLPVLLKDNIDTHDRMQTTAGSLALLGSPMPDDAPLVTRLREAGAVLLGKTNLSEWANFRGRHSTSGWSARGGQTRNPYALDRNPCGSSSGSAVAVAASLCAFAIGTETDGSIVGPSSMNGVVGIKPTVGLVSQKGLIPISSSQDAAGPIARTVRDAALALSVIAGRDYSDFCMSDGLRGARLGIARQFMDGGYQSNRIVAGALDALQRAGATLIDPVEIPASEDLGISELIVMQHEFKAGLNAYLANRGGRIGSLADCIAFNRDNADIGSSPTSDRN